MKRAVVRALERLCVHPGVQLVLDRSACVARYANADPGRLPRRASVSADVIKEMCKDKLLKLSPTKPLVSSAKCYVVTVKGRSAYAARKKSVRVRRKAA